MTLAADRSAHERPAPAERARYLTPTNSFKDKLPPVSAAIHRTARDRAFAPDAQTGSYAVDASAALASPVPATTPLLLARYLRIRAGDRLPGTLRATAGIHYVVGGMGETVCGDETVAWGPGDVFSLPGGVASEHRAESDALLWQVTNEPEVAFHRLEPPAPGTVEVVHYPAAEIARQLEAVRAAPDSGDSSGKVVVFATAPFEKMLSVTPTLTVALNSMEPGKAQRAHRHNSVAVTLPILAEGCWSRIDGERVDWEPYATMVTPAGAAHSHHNDGDGLATFLIVQDGGLFYHCRAIGFSFA